MPPSCATAVACPANVTFTVAAPAPVHSAALPATGKVVLPRPDTAVGVRRYLDGPHGQKVGFFTLMRTRILGREEKRSIAAHMSETVLLEIAALFCRSCSETLYTKTSAEPAALISNGTACCAVVGKEGAFIIKKARVRWDERGGGG